MAQTKPNLARFRTSDLQFDLSSEIQMLHYEPLGSENMCSVFAEPFLDLICELLYLRTKLTSHVHVELHQKTS